MSDRRFSVAAMMEWAHRPLAEVEAFAKGFLIQFSQTQAPRGPMQTADAWSGSTIELSTWVLPVSLAPTSQHAFVSIGRLAGNDVVIPDVTVSKFHAIVREVDGHQVLLDGDSHNGTFVNGVRVASRKVGPPVLLRNGDPVRFGSVQTTWVDASGLQEFLRRMAAAGH